jgi:hypothetical protein
LVTTPLSGTNIRLLSGIPFNSDHQHTRWFSSINEQLNWFLNRNTVYVKSEYNFQRIEGHSFIALNESIDDLWNVNYLMFQNSKYNNKWFYAFVTKLEYVQHKTTHVHFQIDVLQTWMFEMNFKPSYVVREHCKLWNTDGTPIINTIDEGLNYGTEYDIVSVENVRAYDDLFFLVIVSKSAMESNNAITASLNGIPQPLNYYVHPFRLNGTSPVCLTTGDFGQTVNASNIFDILTGIMTQDKTVGDIVSLYVTEYFGYNAPYDGTNITFDGNKFKAVTIGSITTIKVVSLPQYEPITKTFTNKYSGYNLSYQSKLNMHPYTVLTLDDFKGNRVDLKNEYINGNDIVVTIKGSLGTSNRVTYSIDNYLQDSNGVYSSITGLEHAVINNNPNDIPILNDMLAAFLQGNRNSIANQKATINFNGMMGMLQSAVGAGSSFVGGMASGNSAAAALGVTQNVIQGIQTAGNSVLQLQAINAKQQDISNVPPSMSSMGSNTNYDYGNFIYGLFLIKKQIKPEYLKKISDFLYMFGFKKNELKVPEFYNRTCWNYVQTENCVITGSFNNDDLQALKNIFNNGVTLWHVDDIGNYSLSNEEI